jgi:dTDP-D-glucose 4,6-dehydratase
MNNLLVTGGAGFIGSNFVYYWLQQFQKVTHSTPGRPA